MFTVRKKSIKWFKLHWEWGQRADTRSSKENPLLKHWSANPEIEKMKLLGWGAVQRKLGREAASHAGQNSGSLEPREAQHSLEKGAWKDNANLIMNPTYKDLIQERPRPWSWPESKMGRPQGRVHAPPWAGFRNYILHLCVLNPCNGFPAIVICATIKTSDAKKKKKNTSDAKVWEPEMRKKAAVQKRQCSTLARRKQEGLMGLIQSQSLYKGGRVVESELWWIRRWSWECICRGEKAVVPSGITFPKGERGLSVMRFKLIPTIASAPEAFSNSKQTLRKENFICKNTFWLHGIP